MKSILPLAIAAACIGASIAASVHAGDSVAETLPPATEGEFGEQDWFGPPYIRFGRKNADSSLPGYAFAAGSYTYRAETDFDSLPGEVSSDDFSIWAPYAAINKEEFHLFAFINYSATKYDTSVPNLLTEDTLQAIYAPVVFIHDISEDWIWGGMVMPSYSGSDSSSDNFAISAALGVGYGYSDNLDLFAGVYYYHGFGEDYILPGAAFIWRPAPRWEAYLLPPIGGVSYSINDRWMVSLYGQYHSPTWHVKADSDGPDRDINVSSLRIGAKVEYNLHGWLWAFAGAGYSIGQELDIEDTDDHTLQKDDIDATPFVQIGFTLRL